MTKQIALNVQQAHVHFRSGVSTAMVIVSYTDGTFDIVCAVENSETGQKFARVFACEPHDEHLSRATNWQLACLRGLDPLAVEDDTPKPLRVVARPHPQSVELGQAAEAFREYAAAIDVGQSLEDLRPRLRQLSHAIETILATP
jgi:hypothetical protein